MLDFYVETFHELPLWKFTISLHIKIQHKETHNFYVELDFYVETYHELPQRPDLAMALFHRTLNMDDIFLLRAARTFPTPR